MNTIKLNKRVLTTKKQRGQGMTEYIIIVALIAIAAIALFSTFGGTIKAEVAQVTNGLAGQTNGVTQAKARADAQAQKSVGLAQKDNGMDKYGADVKPQ